MPASEKTSLGFCKWAESDKPARLDFCGDNELLDTLLSSHLQDTDLHFTEQSREMLKGARVGMYVGDGNATQSFTLPIEPGAVLVAAMGVGWSLFTGSVTEHYAGVAAQTDTQFYYTDGISLSGTVVTVSESQTVSADSSYGSANRLNHQGQVYFWIAIP